MFLLGVVAECQQERSQLKNKEKAMKALRAKLYSMKLEEATSKRYNQRKIQVRLHAVKLGQEIEMSEGNIKYRSTINTNKCDSGVDWLLLKYNQAKGSMHFSVGDFYMLKRS